MTESWYASTDRDALEEIASLPAPRVEELFRLSEEGNAIVGACQVGDVLTGTALAVVTADGQPHCLWPLEGTSNEQVQPLQDEWTPVQGSPAHS